VPPSSKAWFQGLEPVPCDIRWTEAPERHRWQGVLDRVVRFNPDSRTLTVAVRIQADRMVSQNGAMPLVEGMFCKVSIPGRTVTDIVRLPRWCVSFDQQVFLAVDQRLKTVPVEVLRTEGEEVLVAGGLQPGDRVVTTRLVDPLENSLLDVSPDS
jgi:multidrug efflux pump subunit AcrA (membrane-fusion protein)